MASNTIIDGNWEGYFEYGYEYGPEMAGKRVTFHLSLKEIGNGQFTGECIETDGFGINPGKAVIKGFVEASFISFTKEYSVYYQVDENGNEIEEQGHPKPIINYFGNYDWQKKSFRRKWEILMTHEDNLQGNFVMAGEGTWKMHRVN